MTVGYLPAAREPSHATAVGPGASPLATAAAEDDASARAGPDDASAEVLHDTSHLPATDATAAAARRPA